MPFEVPTLPALVARAEEDLARAGVNGMLRRADSNVIARVAGGGAYGLYGYLSWIARQALPDKCDEDMLARWAALKNVPRKRAFKASGFLQVSGAEDVSVAAGAVWQTRAGIKLIASEEVPIVDGAAAVPVAALEAGAQGNMVAGTRVSAVSPLPGVLDRATVGVEGIGGGVDVEELEQWRRRVLRAFRIVPHGGARDDYETWALDVAGITRAWTRPRWVGPGTVGLFIVRDGDADIIPSPAEAERVRDDIEAVRPVLAELYVLPPTPLPVHYHLEVTPDTEAVRLRTEQALRKLHLEQADLGGRFYRSHMTEVISAVPGELDHVLIEPAADIVPAANELPVFGSVTWA